MHKGNTKVKEIMCNNVKTCQRETLLQDVARMMSETDCGAIPVVESKDNPSPIGIITDRDIATKTLAKGLNPFDQQVKSYLSSPCYTIREDQSLDDTLRLMEKNQVRRVVVVDGDNKKCRGILAQADIAEHCTDTKTARLLRKISKPIRTRKERVA